MVKSFDFPFVASFLEVIEYDFYYYFKYGEGDFRIKWYHTLITLWKFEMVIFVELIKGNIGIIALLNIRLDFIWANVICYNNRD